MFALLLLAAVGSPATTTVDPAVDIQCVATLAIVANEQKRGTGWSDVAPLAKSGSRYAAVVGVQVMKATGRSREAVGAMIRSEIARAQRTGKIDRADVDRCMARVDAVAPAPPPPTLPRCAAIMALAYDALRARDGLTKDAQDLGTMASVLAYRARTEGMAAGANEREVDDAITAQRTAAAKAGGASDDELQACAELAVAHP